MGLVIFSILVSFAFRTAVLYVAWNYLVLDLLAGAQPASILQIAALSCFSAVLTPVVAAKNKE